MTINDINDIIEILLARKYIITWIVVGWLLVVFFIVKPLHKMSVWGNVVRGIGELSLAGSWAILCAILLHHFPGFSMMLFVVFGLFHRVRRWKDKSGEDKKQARAMIGTGFVLIYILSLLFIRSKMGYDFAHDWRRGVSQLTSNTVFAEAGKRSGHFPSEIPLMRTGIRPSAPPKAVRADSSFLPFRLRGGALSTSVAVKKPIPAKQR